jgi:hypothetical protein
MILLHTLIRITRIGMKHADIFGALYITSPCCLAPRGAGPVNAANEKALEAVQTPDDSAKLPFMLRALASAAAWSPNPKNPPLDLDLRTKDGVVQSGRHCQMGSQGPLASVDQYIGNLRQYKAIAIDVGDQDGPRA